MSIEEIKESLRLASRRCPMNHVHVDALLDDLLLAMRSGASSEAPAEGCGDLADYIAGCITRSMNRKP